MTKMDVMSINIHRMFEYLFCADESSSFLNLRFENDVKMYGTQTLRLLQYRKTEFENDVKMYGTQTTLNSIPTFLVFENDVKMYGTQTHTGLNSRTCLFENDVKMYGTQTLRSQFPQQRGLRMM